MSLLRCCIFLFVLAIGASPIQAVSRADDVLHSTGFTKDDIQQVHSGQLAKVMVESADERDLAVRFAFLIKSPVDTVREAFMNSIYKKEADPSITALGAIEGEGSVEDFNGLKLDPNPDDKVSKSYLDAVPGSDLNLSQEEIDSFNALKDEDTAETEGVENCLRNTLLKRHRSYLQNGLKGMLPYKRKKGAFEPGKALRRKTELAKVLKREAPVFHRLLMDYPKSKPKGLEEQYSWINFNIDDKPTFALVHKMSLLEGDVFVFSERHFYVSRSHNSVQGIGGIFPVKEGSLVIYLTRTGTDQVAGFGGSTKRAFGQRIMGGKIAENIERVREIEAQNYQ